MHIAKYEIAPTGESPTCAQQSPVAEAEFAVRKRPSVPTGRALNVLAAVPAIKSPFAVTVEHGIDPGPQQRPVVQAELAIRVHPLPPTAKALGVEAALADNMVPFAV